MWALRRTFLGISVLAVGASVFLLLFLRSRGPLLAAPGQEETFDRDRFCDCPFVAGQVFSCLLGRTGPSCFWFSS